MGFVEQSRAKLNDENTIYEEIAEGKTLIAMGDGEMDIRKFIANVLFFSSFFSPLAVLLTFFFLSFLFFVDSFRSVEKIRRNSLET